MQGAVAVLISISLQIILPRNLPLIFFHRLRIDTITVMSLWSRFLAHTVQAVWTRDRRQLLLVLRLRVSVHDTRAVDLMADACLRLGRTKVVL